MLATNNFTFGLLTPVLAYAMSCVGAFIGLRCTTRAYAYDERLARIRWLALAAVSLGTTGIWVMHFIGMLGYSVAGQTVRFNVTITIASLVIAVLVVFAGLLIVGFGESTWRNLLTAGVITGVGVAAMHYVGMAAIEMQASMTYSLPVVALSVVIGIVAATAALWAALRLRGLWATLVASLIMGAAVSGMHYTGVAAMRMERLAPGVHLATPGPTAQVFLLPLLIGIGVVSIILSAVLVFSPTEAEIREDRQLMDRINEATARLSGRAVPVPSAGERRERDGSGRGSGGPGGRPAERGLAARKLPDPHGAPGQLRARGQARDTGPRPGARVRPDTGPRPAAAPRAAAGERRAPDPRHVPGQGRAGR